MDGSNHPLTCAENFSATAELSNEVFKNRNVLRNIIFPDKKQETNVHPDRGPVSAAASRFLG